MKLEIDLTTEQEARLNAAAEARQLEPKAVLEELINTLPPVLSQNNASAEDDEGTLYDLLKGSIGRISSGKTEERLSEDTGEKFTEYLLEKRRQGRL